MTGARPPPLRDAVSGGRHRIEGPAGRLSYYRAGPTDAPPLLLLHSINAAAAAHEVRPLYEHYRDTRAVYAPDLPGYGFSDRAERLYTPRLMTDALHALAGQIRATHGATPIDAIALSLSCEFLARAATEAPGTFRSLAFVSPTGFNRERPLDGPPGHTRGVPWLRRAFRLPLLGRGLFRVLTSRASVRYFLEKTWGSKAIDEAVFEYSWLTTRQPGAHHAPFCFLSAFLFSADASRLYESIAQPVWMVHGVRGDFTDYRRKHDLAHAPNWRIEVMETGALPHFERPAEFRAAYDAFLAAVTAGRDVNPDA